MTRVPPYILYQIHVLAAQGLPVERIVFLTRLSRETVEAELRNPTVAPPPATPPTVTTTGDENSSG